LKYKELAVMEMFMNFIFSTLMMIVLAGGCLFIGVLWKAFKALGIWIDNNDKGPR
jgi:hypothetical protein